MMLLAQISLKDRLLPLVARAALLIMGGFLIRFQYLLRRDWGRQIYCCARRAN